MPPPISPGAGFHPHLCHFREILATSLSSSVIDIVLFTVFSGILQWLHLGHVILAATVGARVISSHL